MLLVRYCMNLESFRLGTTEKLGIELRFNNTFFVAGDSREPELAGVRGALMGSLFALIVTLVLSFPIGVGAAIYLEELAPKNWVTDAIEVNINNLAAVPSIVRHPAPVGPEERDRDDGGPRAGATLVWEPGSDPARSCQWSSSSPSPV